MIRVLYDPCTLPHHTAAHKEMCAWRLLRTLGFIIPVSFALCYISCNILCRGNGGIELGSHISYLTPCTPHTLLCVTFQRVLCAENDEPAAAAAVVKEACDKQAAQGTLSDVHITLEYIYNTRIF